MKVLFLGCLFRRERESEILALSNTGLSNAANTFQWNLIEGLDKKINLDIINVIPVGTFPNKYKKLFLKTVNWSHNNASNNLEVGCLNITLIKQFLRCKLVIKEINKRIKTGEELDNIIIYSTYLPFLRAITKLNKNIKVTLIVTDLPEFYNLSSSSIFHKQLRKMYNKIIYKNIKRIDSFVLLTEQMKYPLEIGNKPYIVIEGLVNKDLYIKSNNKFNTKNISTKIILYTGSLHYQFGIKKLLRAFRMINDDKYELWICGSGEAEEEIKQLSIKEKGIKFFGYLPKAEVSKLQQKATVLINPRTNQGEYTKYSFPSKTMEYMATGKPVIMYKLKGIPDEYDDYLYYIDNHQPAGLSKKIIEVCEKSEEEREDFGEKARLFVINSKNNEVQAEKIIKMINDKNY